MHTDTHMIHVVLFPADTLCNMAQEYEKLCLADAGTFHLWRIPSGANCWSVGRHRLLTDEQE